MKRMFARLLAVTFAALALTAHAANDHGTLVEAEAMVKKAVAFYKKNGRDKAFAELNKSPGPFVDRDIYVTVYNMEGLTLAHINPKMVGKDMIDLRDANGKYTVRERVEAARKAATGYQDLVFFNPVSKKVEPKRVYWERQGDLIFAAGAYNGQ